MSEVQEIMRRYDRLMCNLFEMMVSKKVITQAMHDNLLLWLDAEWKRLNAEEQEIEEICKSIPSNGRMF